MTTKRRRTPKQIMAENDRQALLWAGPFGYAVLEVLRRGDDFGEADFEALMRKAPAGPASRAAAQVEKAARAEALRGRPLIEVLAEDDGLERQVTMSADNPLGSPDFVGDEPYVSKVGAGQVLEPAPPAAFYKRVTPRS